MVPCLHQSNVYIKRKLRVCRAQKCNPCFDAKTPPRSTGIQRTHFHATPYRADSTNLRELGATYRQGIVFNQWNVYIKRKLRVCSAQNVILVSVQKDHFAVRTGTKPCFIKPRKMPAVKICRTLRLPIAMVPFLHQWNVYIKRKISVCRAQTCNHCFGAKSPLRSTDLQKTRFHAAPYRADSTNLQEFGATYRHGTVFVPMEYLHPKEAKCMQCPKR